MERKRVRRRSLLAVRLSRLIAGVLLCSVVLVVQGAERNGEGTTKYGDVDISRLRNADRNPEQWAAMGRTLNGTYYSPLSQINTSNVDKLGFVWQFKTGTYRGMDATPLFVDGVLYFPGIWGSVYALDAATGNENWRFTPKNDGQFAKWAASDVVTRGIAVLNGRVFTISTDCHLFSLNAATGQPARPGDKTVIYEAFKPGSEPGGDNVVVNGYGASDDPPTATPAGGGAPAPHIAPDSGTGGLY